MLKAFFILWNLCFLEILETPFVLLVGENVLDLYAIQQFWLHLTTLSLEPFFYICLDFLMSMYSTRSHIYFCTIHCRFLVVA
jgi:hypothetical protein